MGRPTPRNPFENEPEAPPHDSPVALVACPACGRNISSEAEACPQCGHPNRAATRTAAEPQCYACSAAATTRCQCCGELSCARHVESMYVLYRKANEVRCESCYSRAKSLQLYAMIAAVGFAVAAVVVLLVAKL